MTYPAIVWIAFVSALVAGCVVWFTAPYPVDQLKPLLVVATLIVFLIGVAVILSLIYIFGMLITQILCLVGGIVLFWLSSLPEPRVLALQLAIFGLILILRNVGIRLKNRGKNHSLPN